jgi:hypothetical protein
VNPLPNRCRAAVLSAAALALVAAQVAACGSAPQPDSAGAAGAAPELTVAQAGRVLAAFDTSDSAASVAGNILLLQTDETAPALDDSIAAVHRAQAAHTKQAAYTHTDPLFAIPAGDPGCFLVSATLRSAGSEIPQYDVSQFTRDSAGAWKLDLHVMVEPSAEPELTLTSARPAALSTTAISAARRQALISQIFARTTAQHPDFALVAPSPVLDSELGAGWTFYVQELKAGHMTVSRTMTGAQWSSCAAQAGGSVIAFVTIYAKDTIRPLPGGPGFVELPAQDPDMIGLGRAAGVSGATVTVSRVEEFLLSVPVAANAPAQVLGLIDAPVSVTAAPR